MNKKLKILLIVLAVIIILVIPIKSTKDDGGTVVYNSLTYKIINWHEENITYVEGYKAADGSGTLAAEGSALILYSGDWAKYAFTLVPSAEEIGKGESLWKLHSRLSFRKLRRHGEPLRERSYQILICFL